MKPKKISKDQALELLHEMMYSGRGIVSGRKLSLVELQLIRYSYEALEQQPKRGQWICHRDHCESLGVIPSGLGVYEWCSNCDCGIDIREWQRNPYNYCPNCGAKMEMKE